MAINQEQIKNIICKLKAGDKDAFAELYKIYYPRILSFLIKMLKNKDMSEEITQEVFFRLWVNHQKLNPEMSYDSYFFSIAKNLVLNLYKKQEAEYNYLTSLGEEFFEENNTFEFIELQQLLDETVAKMPPQQQFIFRLSREEGLLNAEIAEKLGISKRTVEKHISNPLSVLRKKILNNFLLFFVA